MTSKRIKISILGCYAATPRTITNPTSQVLEIKNQMFLIDCGEGTQVQLRRNKIKFSRIEHIFISHLHGDHFYGLIGLISTFSLLSRINDLHIYGSVDAVDNVHEQHTIENITNGLLIQRQQKMTSSDPEKVENLVNVENSKFSKNAEKSLA